VQSDTVAGALGDRLLLRQALINLVDNAIKFSPVGGRIAIRISEAAGHVRVDVIDSGSGIEADARAHIFDRFYRAASNPDTKGTGLGLSIAKGAVEANGGRLTLESSGPSGSTFRMTLPRAVSGRQSAIGSKSASGSRP
jgi:signal transduction histidine kinase